MRARQLSPASSRSRAIIRGGIRLSIVAANRAVYLEWLDFGMALDRVPSASGAKYQGRWNDGEWTFWFKRKEALFSQPGKPSVWCAEEVIA